jgi:microcystin-dependent protein
VKTAGGVSANGQLLAISDYNQLFSLLGTTYGGDGQVTFAVPDLRAITPDHMTYSICTHGVWAT